VVKNQAVTKQDRAVFPNLHCFVGTTKIANQMQKMKKSEKIAVKPVVIPLASGVYRGFTLSLE